jgi:hypothetical protein
MLDAMSHEAEAASLRSEADAHANGKADALANGYATVHELETRGLQLERHCDALVAQGADGEQMRTDIR